MKVDMSIPLGQQEARTRWNTHESGAAFDRKKTSYLTEQAKAFIAQQAFCVLAGPGSHFEPCGLFAPSKPGFVQTPNSYTCLLQLDRQSENSCLIRELRQCSQEERGVQLGMFFICHPTRERLCVQGTAYLLPNGYSATLQQESIRIRLHVREVFFHCTKYIKTQIAGLTSSGEPLSKQRWQLEQVLHCTRTALTEAVGVFIQQQVLCFLCTVNQDGQCAVNHRGGTPGFLVSLLPDKYSLGGIILLPDYAGNGAFEAVGNILETRRAALVIPNYSAQVALSISGTAQVVDVVTLHPELVRTCPGAERVVVLAVQHIEVQYGDWSAMLVYERVRAKSCHSATHTCPV